MEDFFKGFSYQSYMTAGALWERMGRKRVKGKREEAHRRLACSKFFFWGCEDLDFILFLFFIFIYKIWVLICRYFIYYPEKFIVIFSGGSICADGRD